MPGSPPVPVELFSDCPHCRLEGGVVELYDVLVGACRFGLPALARCRLCGARAEGVLEGRSARDLHDVPANACPSCVGPLEPSAVDTRRCGLCGVSARLEAVEPPTVPSSREALHGALDAWALEAGFADREALVRATFADPSSDALWERVARGEPLEQLADPFALGARASATSLDDPPSGPNFDDAAPDTVREQGPPSAPPRAVIYPLVSVIVADGEVSHEERAVLDRFLENEGLAPLTEAELVVHPPAECAPFVPAARREDVLRLMCETALADGLPDEAERKVIFAYAAAWGVDPEKVSFWLWGYENMSTSLVRQLWLKIRRFVLSSRWESHADEPGPPPRS